jgi:hypothetical protein
VPRAIGRRLPGVPLEPQRAEQLSALMIGSDAYNAAVSSRGRANASLRSARLRSYAVGLDGMSDLT